MRKLNRFGQGIGICFCWFLFCCTNLQWLEAQMPSAQAPAPVPLTTPGPNLEKKPATDHRIALDVVVTDKAGNALSGLQQQDFTVLDEKQPETITSFHATEQGTDAEPLQVIFLLDAVNTGVQTLNYERQELMKFLRQNGGHLAFPTSLVFLTDTSTELQPLTTRDGNGLADVLNSKETGLRILGRSTGIYGAMERFQLSLDALERLTTYEGRQPGRKLVIWFSPGWPILSGPAIQLTKKNQDWLFNAIVALSDQMRDARLSLYSVDPLGTSDAASFRTFYYESFLKGVRSRNKVDVGNLALQVLATQTGGKVLNSNNDLVRLIASCLMDAKAYYTISFTYPPADHPDEYHNLEVEVDKPGVIARTRTGYYAQPYKTAER